MMTDCTVDAGSIYFLFLDTFKLTYHLQCLIIGDLHYCLYSLRLLFNIFAASAFIYYEEKSNNINSDKLLEQCNMAF